MNKRYDTLLSQPQAAASSPNLGEQQDTIDCGSSSSPKLGEGDHPWVVEESVKEEFE